MEKISAIDHSEMRERNLAVILNALHHSAPISRSGLASNTGLNKATVTSLIRELASANFIRELEEIPSENVGRPATGLGLDPNAGCIISIDIGVDYISAIVTDFTAEVLWRQNVATTTLVNEDAILERSFELAEKAYKISINQPGHIFGISWGVPGLVDMATGTLLFAPNLGWKDVPLRNLAEAKFDIPVYVDNEAKLAALGEAYFGTAQGQDTVLYVSSGVGIGGGIVINGHILSGASGFAGEFGHITMEPDGPPCKCGNYGCWETLASQRALFRSIRDAIDANKQTSLLVAIDGDLNRLTVPIVAEAAKGGDPVALDALKKTGQWLGIGIANLINIFNPHRVVFGGILSVAHEFLLPEIQHEVSTRSLGEACKHCEILIAKYGADATIMGGVAEVYRATMRQVLTWTS